MIASEATNGLWLGSVMAAAGLALGVRRLLSLRDTELHRKLAQYRNWLTRELRFVRSEMSPTSVLALQGVAMVLSLGLGITDPKYSLGGAICAALPALWLKRARQGRVSALEQQIESWLNSLARALDAAPSLGEAIESSRGACDAPMREELDVLVNELRLGRPLDQVLTKWAERVQSRPLTMALSTLQLGRETGGQLGQVLRATAGSLREMERLEGVVRTKTAEGKAQATVISLMPFPLYFAVKASDPKYFLPLETSTSGQLLIALAVALWIAAGFSARKILAVQI